MTILDSCKVGVDFRFTLPQKVREILELKEGDNIVFYTREVSNGRVCLRRA